MKTLEKWQTITSYKDYEFDGKYEISNWGNIRNRDTKAPLATYSNNRGQGYLKTKITDKSKKRRIMYIHQLVAYFFVSGYDTNKEVNHKDGNAKNNSFSNLEWVSHKENVRHFYSNCRKEA